MTVRKTSENQIGILQQLFQPVVIPQKPVVNETKAAIIKPKDNRSPQQVIAERNSFERADEQRSFLNQKLESAEIKSTAAKTDFGVLLEKIKNESKRNEPATFSLFDARSPIAGSSDSIFTQLQPPSETQNQPPDLLFLQQPTNQSPQIAAPDLLQTEAAELVNSNGDTAFQKTAEIAQRLGLTAEQRTTLVGETATAMELHGANDDADKLRALDAVRRLDEESIARKFTPAQRAVRSLDYAAEQLEAGNGKTAANFLESEAKRAREAARALAPDSAAAKMLNCFADNAEIRVTAYRAVSPKDSYDAAGKLADVSSRTRQTADELQRQGRGAEARTLKAIADDSRVQASIMADGAANTNALVGRGISETYKQIVNASFDKKIDETGTLFGLRPGTRDKLMEDRTKMQVVFHELDRTMREEGVSFDTAWSRMFNDNVMDGGKSGRRVPGFISRNDAATFLRDHEVTKGLLMPFSDLAKSFSNGDAAGIDRAQAALVKSLRENGQWEISRAVLDGHLKSARTPEGQQTAKQLDGSERGEWWKAKAGEFILDELPVLVLTGLLSGGAGWGVKALTTTAKWGPRMVRAATLTTELAVSVPTERVLNEVINGKRADWSTGALARDYAFTVGGYGLFRLAGKGWQMFRSRGAGSELIGKSFVGPQFDDAIKAADRAITSLDTAIPIPKGKSTEILALVKQTQTASRELELLRDSLKLNPSAVGKETLEQLTREADNLNRVAREYVALERPQLPKGQRPTPAELDAHQRATADFVQRKADLRKSLTQQVNSYSEKLFVASSKTAGVSVAKYDPTAGQFKNDPAQQIFKLRKNPQILDRGNAGYSELRLGDEVIPEGPAISGTEAGSLSPRSQPGLIAETRQLTGQEARRSLFNSELGRHGGSRANDSEVQLMERATERLKGNPNASGTLKIYTEMPPCSSCLRVMARFRQMHPNVKVEVFYSEKHNLPWGAWLAGQQRREITGEK